MYIIALKAMLPNINSYVLNDTNPPWGTLNMFIYHFLGLKILNFNLFLGFQKNEYFWGHEDFVGIFLGVITKMDWF